MVPYLPTVMPIIICILSIIIIIVVVVVVVVVVVILPSLRLLVKGANQQKVLRRESTSVRVDLDLYL